MPRYRVAREWRDYVIAIDVVSCHSIRMVKAGVVDASRASKRRARGALPFHLGLSYAQLPLALCDGRAFVQDMSAISRV